MSCISSKRKHFLDATVFSFTLFLNKLLFFLFLFLNIFFIHGCKCKRKNIGNTIKDENKNNNANRSDKWRHQFAPAKLEQLISYRKAKTKRLVVDSPIAETRVQKLVSLITVSTVRIREAVSLITVSTLAQNKSCKSQEGFHTYTQTL